MTTYALGRRVEHDPASRQFAYNTRKLTLRSAIHPRRVPILNQGSLGSCTGNAAVGCLGTGPFYGTVRRLVSSWDEAFAVSVYSQATHLDGFDGSYPPDDTGSSGLAVAKALKVRRLIDSYYHTFTFQDALLAVGRKPGITGINWYDSMFEPGIDGIARITPRAEVVGGHEIVLDEVNVEAMLVGFQNSWGPQWGIGGRFYLTFADYERLLDEDGDVTFFKRITTGSTTQGILERICEKVRS